MNKEPVYPVGVISVLEAVGCSVQNDESKEQITLNLPLEEKGITLPYHEVVSLGAKGVMDVLLSEAIVRHVNSAVEDVREEVIRTLDSFVDKS